jgi:hypothetical protein
MPPFDTQTPSDLEGVRALKERMEAAGVQPKAFGSPAEKSAWMDEMIRRAKGGNPRKLVGARDLHKHSFADISAQTAKWRV